MTDVDDTSFLDYSVGDKSSAGRLIKFIYGQSDEVIVYEGEDGRVHWESADWPPHHIEVHQKYDRLYAMVCGAIGKRKQASLVAELAQALFRGLSESVREQALAHFDDVDARITLEAMVRSRIYYVSFSTLAMLSVAVGLAVAYYVPFLDMS